MKKQKSKAGLTPTSPSGFAAPDHASKPQHPPKLPSAELKIPALLLEGDDPPPPPFPPEGPKFALTPTPAAGQTSATLGELPESYGTGQLVLLARDPHCLYAHWDLNADQQSRFNTLSNDGHLVLRVAAEASPATEVRLDPQARSWFVQVDRAGVAYTADLGYYQGEAWNSLATSAPASTPTDRPSPDKMVRFAELGVAAQFASTGKSMESGPSQESSHSLAPPRVEWIPALEQPVTQLLKSRPRPEMQALEGPEWTATQAQALADMLGPDPLRRSTLSSLELTEWVRREIQREIAAVQFAEPLAAAVSSPSGEPPTLQAFWFNVNAELIIYGATEPTATVSLAGRPIELRADGTFSCRFALPDGEYEFELAATSVRKESLHAKLKFRRNTEEPGATPAG